MWPCARRSPGSERASDRVLARPPPTPPNCLLRGSSYVSSSGRLRRQVPTGRRPPKRGTTPLPHETALPRLLPRRDLLKLLAGAGSLCLAGLLPFGPARAERKKAAPSEVALDELLKPGPLPELTLGKSDAPITVVEYASMTCGHCANFHNKVFPQLKEKYIDS